MAPREPTDRARFPHAPHGRASGLRRIRHINTVAESGTRRTGRATRVAQRGCHDHRASAKSLPGPHRVLPGHRPYRLDHAQPRRVGQRNHGPRRRSGCSRAGRADKRLVGHSATPLQASRCSEGASSSSLKQAGTPAFTARRAQGLVLVSTPSRIRVTRGWRFAALRLTRRGQYRVTPPSPAWPVSVSYSPRR